jgi:hypothetical protein
MDKNFNIQKLKELILFITEENIKNSRFGSTVLNKMLYFADFYWFAYCGKSISGDEYIRREFGPTPKNILQAREELLDEGFLEMQEVNFYGKLQKRPVLKKQSEYNELSNDERQFITEVVIETFRGLNASEISDISHTSLWKILNDGDIIPYETAHMQSKNEIPDSTIQWAINAITKRESKRWTSLNYENQTIAVNA